MAKKLNNPFYVYCISFLIGIAVYSLKWSYLFPSLKSSLIVFIFFTISVFAISGFFFDQIVEFKNTSTLSAIKYDKIIFVFFLISFCFEFIHFGGVPLFLLIKNLQVDYLEFGIPTFHVFVITFAHFFLGYCYARYRVGRNKQYVFFTIVILINDLLIVSRGMFIFGLLILFFVHIALIKKILAKHMIWGLLFSVFVAFGFGLIGKLRAAKGNEKYVLQIFGASQTFYDANISSSFLWAYIYISSPLANLQKTIDNNLHHPDNIKGLFINEMLNEVISKRIPYHKNEASHNYRIAHYLTVGSIYFAPYNRMGWAGMIYIFIYLFVYIIFYRVLLVIFPRFSIAGIAILNALVLLCLFDNMFKEAFAVTLAYPLIFDIAKRIKIRFISPYININ